MATPSNINNVIQFNTANTYLAGTYQVQGFTVNASANNWVAELQDKNSLPIVMATGSMASTFGHTLNKAILVTNPSVAVSTNVSNILLYLE